MSLDKHRIFLSYHRLVNFQYQEFYYYFDLDKQVIVAVSGYFDPLHVGHVEFFQLAKELGSKLIVIVNNNQQAEMKKGSFFMDEKDRMEIVAALRHVDEVFLSIDSDGSVCKSLEAIKPDIFANGGDRSLEEIPETAVMKKYNIKMVDGLGEKIRSSSDLTGIGK